MVALERAGIPAVGIVAQSFVKAWANEKGLKVCGLHEVEGCSEAPVEPEGPGLLDKILVILEKLLVILEDFFEDKS